MCAEARFGWFVWFADGRCGEGVERSWRRVRLRVRDGLARGLELTALWAVGDWRKEGGSWRWLVTWLADREQRGRERAGRSWWAVSCELDGDGGCAVVGWTGLVAARSGVGGGLAV